MTRADPAPSPASVGAIDYAGADWAGPGGLDRLFLRPLGWPTTAAAAGAAALVLYMQAGVAGGLVAGLIGFAVWVIVIAVWAVRLAGHTLVSNRFGRKAALRRTLWRWLPTALFLVLTIELCQTEAPAAAAFRLSRPAMERAARAALAGPRGRYTPVEVGLYGRVYVRVLGPVVYVLVPNLPSGPGEGAADLRGYAYSPDGEPTGNGDCRPIGGHWYRWHQRYGYSAL